MKKDMIAEFLEMVVADANLCDKNQLAHAASTLALPENEYRCMTTDDFIESQTPSNWEENDFDRLINMPYEERLVVAIAFLAKEKERINKKPL